MESSLELCASLQREEWEVLESIYPDCVSSDICDGILKLQIPVELPEAAEIAVIDDLPVQHSGASHEATASHISLSHLPPLLLDILLPPTYPNTAPKIISLHATHSWLPIKRLSVQRRLLELWQEGDGVLCSWVEWIRSAQFLHDLDLVTTLNREQMIRIHHPSPRLLVPLLTAYDTSTKSAKFSQNSYECEICLTSIKGGRCILLSCSHVFCRSCLEDFWKLCIKEGDVGRVGCPDPKCVKSGREANEEEVRRVITEEEVRRWKWLKEKRAIEKDPSIIHCPVPLCQTPVPKPANTEEGSSWERLRTCPECGYSFCAYCRRTWHGPISDCPLSVTESFVMEYMALPEDSSQRKTLEMRYGKANLRKLVVRYEEEQALKSWLERSTMACPNCHVHVEKSMGCNHMTCARCGNHFCYRCGEKLNAKNPYEHFSRKGHPCFSKLFDFESIDDEWQPVEGFDAMI
ncbi:E3 ubiquitin-protein ligase itt1 [Grifola frondosa]|uniref:RBR-type E3 ubiquitin transferase n=1 Tax=Grifola frondosa TaxID=5627 RepID=A0A1C7MUZ9_GRIFR|nr:E3 ubiquitin-protein ligase itt1 [Grifola frondosa]